MNERIEKSARNAAYIGVAAASILAVKFALSFLANVELVTLLTVFYTLKLGYKRTLIAVNVFILADTCIYGFGVWILYYLIHWNALVILIAFLKIRSVKASVAYAFAATLLTLLFGVQTTCLDVLFFSNATDFLYSFGLKYFMGIPFFLAQMASAFFGVWLLLPILMKLPINVAG